MIKKIVLFIYHFLYAKINHIGYAKYIGVNIGENCHIYSNPFDMFGTEPWCITLGNNVHITKEVLFITHDGGTLLFRNIVPDLEITAPIIIGNNVYIGVRSIILPGVVVGNNCIIAAGSVVSKNVPDDTVVGGCPARRIKSINEYFEGIKIRSLHLGHLKSKEKDNALKILFTKR
jgi:acetyltransferase-like isoleucine patch superfamily enzyme